jgi:cytochrome c biogenesis protein CcmG/thiol:disulfide interchange protein DsbE
MPRVKAAHPNVGWTLTNDKHIRLSDYQDKVVVLDFYATWCEPCRDSIPHLVDLQKRYGPQGLQIVGLNLGGQDDYDKVPEFAREFHIQYPLGIPDPELENLYINDDAIPQTLVIDRQGQLLKHFVGYDDSMGEELERAIQSSLGPRQASQR